MKGEKEEREEPVQDGRTTCGRYLPHRYQLFLLVFFLTLVVYTSRSSFTLAVVAMVNNTNPDANISSVCPPSKADNSSKPITDGEFGWSPSLQSHILSSFFYTYIILQIPGGYLSERFGAKWVIFSCALFPGILYALVPPLARLSPYALIVIQAISGLFQGALFPAIHAMWARWAPAKERTTLISNSVTGLVAGQLIAYALTGYLSDSTFLGGWPSVFYIFGGLNVGYAIIWALFAHSTPATDPGISTEEREYIERETRIKDPTKYTRPPYVKMFTSPAVLAMLTISFCNNFYFYVQFSTVPFYMQQILRFSNTQIGLINTIPVAMSFIGSMLFPILADIVRAKHLVSTTNTRKATIFLGTVGMSAVFLLVPVVGCDRVAAITVVIVASFINTACRTAFPVLATDMAPQYAGTITGASNMIGNACGFIAPLVVESLSGLSVSPSGWSDVFYTTCAVTSFGGIVFLVFGSGELQEWAKPEADIMRVPNTDQIELDKNIPEVSGRIDSTDKMDGKGVVGTALDTLKMPESRWSSEAGDINISRNNSTDALASTYM